jgi:hypothetical protein
VVPDYHGFVRFFHFLSLPLPLDDFLFRLAGVGPAIFSVLISSLLASFRLKAAERFG